METIKYKILGWDEESQTLICCFASDETANNNPEAYTSYAFQPATMWPHATTASRVREEIARAGMGIADQIKANEELASNSSRMEMYRGLANTSGEYTVSSLVSPGTAANTVTVSSVEV